MFNWIRLWLVATFSDADGVPSFKRQIGAILIAACIYGAYKNIDITPLAVLAGSILGLTEVKNLGGRK